jgi:glycosyltransferase involved in cell wall biosynthesis
MISHDLRAGDPLGLVVDLQAAQSHAHGDRGIARYARELTAALVRAGAPIRAVVTNPELPSPRGLPDEITRLLRPATAETFRVLRATAPYALFLLSPMEQQLAPLRTFSRRGIELADAVVTMMYDVIPLLFPERYLTATNRRSYLARLTVVRHADLVLTDSESTRRDVIHHLDLAPGRVVDIGGGASEHFAPPASAIDAGSADDSAEHGALHRAVPSITGPYVLCVSGWDWRKNTETLISAYARLSPEVRADRQLVVACGVPAEGRHAWRELAHAEGLAPQELVITGFVDDDVLRSLYQGTELFVFPSRYEGYGLPLVEAARCGAPVICADASSLPELIELPAARFDPDDVDELTTLLQRGLADEPFRRELHAAAARLAARQTWDACVQRALAAVSRLRSPAHAAQRPSPAWRLGIVGPLPPVRSGISQYDESLLHELADRSSGLTWYADGGREADPFAARVAMRNLRRSTGVHVLPVEALGSRVSASDHDLMVAVLGNGPAHVGALEMANAHRSVVWLHDVDLVGLHLSWAHVLAARPTRRRARPAAEHLANMFARCYGARLPIRVRHGDGSIDHAAIEREGLLLVAGIARRARIVVVNSSVAADLVRRDLARAAVPTQEWPEIAVISLGVPAWTPPAALVRRSPGLVVSLGVVDAVKRPHDLVRSVAASSHAHRLVFAGSCTEGARDEIRILADDLGVGDRVQCTGHLDAEAYREWLARASLVVQLRRPGQGESSAALHDALAAGVPVVSDIASARDLPGGTLRFLDPGASAIAVTDAIDDILGHEEAWRAQRQAGLAYAQRWGFGAVADALLSRISTLA